MWHLDKPTKTAQETYELCISLVQNASLRQRLQSITTNIVDAETEFVERAENNQTHRIARGNSVAGIVTATEMRDVYDQRMVKKDSPGRPIYDEILSAPAHARCPLCGHRTVSTLDHYLPKMEYSALAVTPANLVPSCKDCNYAKFQACPNSSAEEMIHPYFDDIGAEPWLEAKVVETKPAALRFFVATPIAWDTVMVARVRKHFDQLGLAALYGSNAATELIQIRGALTKILLANGTAGVEQHLRDQAHSRAQAFANSWQAATYTALANSTWFCTGGFSS